MFEYNAAKRNVTHLVFKNKTGTCAYYAPHKPNGICRKYTKLEDKHFMSNDIIEGFYLPLYINALDRYIKKSHDISNSSPLISFEASAYSPTRFSKFVLPSILIISIKSNGLLALYIFSLNLTVNLSATNSVYYDMSHSCQ